MVLITSENGYIKMDFTTNPQYKDHSIIYILEGSIVSVKLSRNADSVEFVCEDYIYELDVNGVRGFNALVNNKASITNIQLAEKLAKLKAL